MIQSRPAAVLSASTSRPSRGRAEAAHSVWHVFTEIGTQVMTLAAMETALQRGDVSLSTLVWIPGMMEWEPLGEVANLQNAALVAADPERVSRVQVRAFRADGELARPACNGARTAHPSLAKASGKGAVQPAETGAQTERKRSSLKSDALRRWRRAATLLAALVLTLLGGWRLAQAVASQPQRFGAPGAISPAEAI